MVDPASITIEQMIVCARRELAMRRTVYPRRVGNQMMTQDQADLETAKMEAILALLEAQVWRTDFENAPKGLSNPCLICFDDPEAGPVCGEAWFNEGEGPDDPNRGWWWAGAPPRGNLQCWRPMPAPPSMPAQRSLL